MGEIVTAKELASYLNLKESTVQRLASQRKLPGFKRGKSWRFDVEFIHLFPGPNPTMRKNEGRYADD